MAEWERYSINLGEDGTADVEARETASGSLEWRGIAGTTFDSWCGGMPRTEQPINEQVQEVAADWYHNTKMV